MSDVEQDATVDTDDSATTQENVDWQKRFTDTQAEYTKQQQAYKELQAILDDEDKLIQTIGEKYPHLIADEETVEDDDSSDYDDDEQPEFMTKAEFKAHQDEQKAEQTAKEAQAQFNSDLKEIVGERELDKYGMAAILSGTYKNRDELETAVSEWFEYTEPLHTTKRRRKPTAAVQGGKAATGVPNYDDMNHDEAVAAMVERARSRDTQT